MKRLLLLLILFVNLQISFVDKTICVSSQLASAQVLENEHRTLKMPEYYCDMHDLYLYEDEVVPHLQSTHQILKCPKCKKTYWEGINHVCDDSGDIDSNNEKNKGGKGSGGSNNNGYNGTLPNDKIDGVKIDGVDGVVPDYGSGKSKGGSYGYVHSGVFIVVSVPGWGQDTSGTYTYSGKKEERTNIPINNNLPNGQFEGRCISCELAEEDRARSKLFGWSGYTDFDEESYIQIQPQTKAPCPDDPEGFNSATQPGAFEGAVMSELAYGNEKTRNKCKDKLKDDYGWEVADEEATKMDIKLHDSDTGLDCTLLKNHDGSGFVLAFAGTDPEQTNVAKAAILETLLSGLSLNFIQQILAGFPGFSMLPDVKTDLYQWFYGMDPQYFRAMATAKNLTSELKKKYGDNVKITFVGHSLGGGLASLASIVTGYPALTYNAAALSPMSKLELKMMGYNIDSSQINRYTMEKDPLTGLQCKCSLLAKFTDMFDYNALGEEHEVRYDDDVSWYEKLNPLKNHSCVTIIDNLDCDEIKWSSK